MGSTPFSSVMGGIVALIFGTLVKHRTLWFLHDETILSGGKQVPTAEFSATLSMGAYIAGTVFIVLGFVLLLTLSEERKRRISQMSRWQRFLVWPIDRHITPRKHG